MACKAGALAPAAHAGRAYVSNEDGHSVTVLDTQRAEVIATIEVGKRPRGLKLDRAGSRLYVACHTSDDVWRNGSATARPSNRVRASGASAPFTTTRAQLRSGNSPARASNRAG